MACPLCAAKVEEALRARPEIAQATLSFASATVAVAPVTYRPESELLELCNQVAGDVDGTMFFQIERPAGEKRRWSLSKQQLALALAAVAFSLGFLGVLPVALRIGLCGVAWALAGWPVFRAAWAGLKRRDLFNENTLMTVATLGAWALGDASEAAAVMIFYQIGEQLQGYAVNRSRRNIAALMDIRPQWANLMEGGTTRRVEPSELKVGDRIVIAAGERVPVDAVVLTGRSSLDLAALTGESAPVDVSQGSGLLSGAVNVSGTLEAQVTRSYSDSTVARILEMVEDASAYKAPTEQLVTRLARIYTPIVFFGALAVGLVPPLLGGQWSQWIYRALVFLVISCPCALVVSVPMTFFAGIGAASRQGILVKGGNYLEALSRMEVAVYDKTGTLTEGRFSVTGLYPAEAVSEEELLGTAAALEAGSNHPIARSIVQAWQERGHPAPQRLLELEELAGRGLTALMEGHRVSAGNQALMESLGLPVQSDDGQTSVWVARDGLLLGRVAVADRIKQDSAAAIAALRDQGVSHQVMVSGDRPEIAQAVGRQLGLDEVRGGLLPDGKVQAVEELKARRSKKGTLVFVGDGINDAPVLAAADVGVAMGGLGSDAAIEAADVVLMTDEPSKLASGHRLARRVLAIARQNIVLALGVKVLFMALGTLGLAGLWAAVFADVGVTLLAVLNALRALLTPRS